MTIKESVTEKEKNVKTLLEQLRNNLNKESVNFNTNPNSWSYLTSLAYAENKLKELLEYFESNPDLRY